MTVIKLVGKLTAVLEYLSIAECFTFRIHHSTVQSDLPTIFNNSAMGANCVNSLKIILKP